MVLFLGVHLPAIGYDFVWTDQGEIENGLLVRQPGRILAAFAEPMHPELAQLSPGAVQPYYRPLHVVVVSLIDHHLGRRPSAFRAVNLAVGAATVAAFWLLVRLLLGDARLAALAAALVAVHPAGIENYVWIAGLGSALAALFIVCSLLGVPLIQRARSVPEKIALIAGSSLGLVTGLLCKEAAIVTPALSVASIFTLVGLDSGDVGEADARPVWPWPRALFALVVAQLCIVGFYVLYLRPAILGGILSGAPYVGDDVIVHFATAMATWPNRLAWLLLPFQSTTSDVVRISSFAQPLALAGLALLLSAPYVWYRLVRERHPLAALGWAWIWIAFLPTSGLVPLTHMVAVRYLSLPVFGMALIIIDVVSAAVRNSGDPRRRFAVGALCAILVFGLAQRTLVRIPDWQSDLVLFGREVERHPLYREGYYILAVALAEEGRFEEAKQRIVQLQLAEEASAGYSSFLRRSDALVLVCGLNLELGEAAATVQLLAGRLRPDSSLIRTAPRLMACAAESLDRVGRTNEARELRRALDRPGGR